MARASTYTLLSLDRWASIFGVQPLGFNSGTASIFASNSNCSEVWWSYQWQNNRTAREDVAAVIKSAEDEIARALGYWPAPVWILGDAEIHSYPKYHQREVAFGPQWNARGREKSIRTHWGKVIAPGRKVSTLVGSPRIAYSDADADGFSETATITQAVTTTDIREMRFYDPSQSGHDEWEIRPPRTISISGGTLTATFWTWQCILPSLWEEFPGTDGMEAIDVSNVANLLATMDVYRVYNDSTQAASQFVWEPDVTDDIDDITNPTQNGTFLIRDYEEGHIVPYPATYDTSWTLDAWTENIEADKVKLWYYCGERDDAYLSSLTTDPLSDFWAKTIAWLAVARLNTPFCSCGGAKAIAEDLRIDLALQTSGVSYAAQDEILGNPFGTRKGEVLAWKRCSRFAESQVMGATI